MSTISAGELKHRVRFQSATMVQDSMGAPNRTWVDVATVWADIQSLAGRDLVIAQRISNEISHQITVRYQAIFSDPKTVSAYRGLYRSRVFQIHAALNEGEQNVFVTLYASEGVDDG